MRYNTNINMEEFGLEKGERIVRKVRAHWIVLVGSLLPIAVLAIAPFAIKPLLNFSTSATPALAIITKNITLFSNSPLAHTVLGLWWLLLWIGAFNTITYYFLNVWVLTTERLVEIRQPRYFNRKVSSFFLSRVQDVSSDVNGVLGTLFGFGFIHVETAGESETFEMHGIRRPNALRDIILHEIDEIHRNHAGNSGTDGL